MTALALASLLRANSEPDREWGQGLLFAYGLRAPLRRGLGELYCLVCREETGWCYCPVDAVDAERVAR